MQSISAFASKCSRRCARGMHPDASKYTINNRICNSICVNEMKVSIYRFHIYIENFNVFGQFGAHQTRVAFRSWIPTNQITKSWNLHTQKKTSETTTAKTKPERKHCPSTAEYRTMYRNVLRSFTKWKKKRTKTKKRVHAQSGFQWRFFKWFLFHFIFMFDSFVCIVRSNNVCKWTQCRKKEGNTIFTVRFVIIRIHAQWHVNAFRFLFCSFVFHLRVIINASTRLFSSSSLFLDGETDTMVMVTDVDRQCVHKRNNF